jgi:hypothetical protein
VSGGRIWEVRSVLQFSMSHSERNGWSATWTTVH